MSSWADLVPLGELGEVVSGSTPDTTNRDYWGGEIPWLTPADLTGHAGIYLRGELRKITEAGYDSCSTRMLPAGSIVFSSRAPIGHCAVTAYPLCTNQGFKSLIPSKRLDAVYGFFALKFFTPGLVALGRGATFLEISKEIFEGFRIPLPPLAEQKRIAGILAKADRLRRLRRYALELSEGYVQAVFVEMFGEPVANPMGWPVAKMGELGEVQGGLQLSSRRDSLPLKAPYLRVANVYRDALDLAEIKMIGLTRAELERVRLRCDDLLIVEGHGNIEEIGRCAVWIGGIDDCVHQNHLIRVRVDRERVDCTYLSRFINSAAGRDYFRRASHTTSGLNTISTSTVKRCPVLLPPPDQQRAFASMVRRQERLRGQQREALRQAEQLFEGLLGRAFRGELRAES
ncbi:MAG TPA: restriction endonuclease subunit S [Anaerolineae bacterium]|nr:restriction endonuclease subunit S [Anaerolineae bacterium]HPL29009.1 restriction endonuclease subunit S [Anaerolineae bacterium]